MEKLLHHRFAAAVLAGAAALLLTACGGGGGDYVPAPGLSETQGVFEETALAGNGGMFNLAFGFGIGTGGSGELTSITSSNLTLPESPLGKPDGVQASYTPAHDLASWLLTGPARDEGNPNVGAAVMIGGQIQFIPAQAAPKVTYFNGDVLLEYRTTAGAVGTTMRITSVRGAQMFGTWRDVPQELLNVYDVVARYSRNPVQMAQGSKYFILTAIRVGEQLTLLDADGDPQTQPQSATAVAEGTLEQFAATRPDYLSLARGTIKTVKGARCWVNSRDNLTDGPNPVQITYRLNPTFGAFCEFAGRVYQAGYTPDGAQFGTLYPPAVGGQPIPRVPYLFRFNRYANDTFTAMFK